MKRKYRLFQRSNGIFFIQNNVTGRQKSLRTQDKEAAPWTFHAKNEAQEQPQEFRPDKGSCQTRQERYFLLKILRST